MAHALQCLCDGRACCPVRALQLVICRFGGVHRRRCFNSLFHRIGTGWCENSTRWKSCKRIQVRGGGAWACLVHALQCLCDGRACCPARALQLVICVFLRFHRHRHPVVSTRCFTELVRGGVKIPQDGNRANTYEHVAVVPEHVWRTVCSVCATGARVARPVPCNS